MTAIAHDPQIVAGMLPQGATGALLQDRAGSWHEATAARGAWPCVLPQRSGQTDPQVAYLDAGGNRFEPGEDDWFIEQNIPDVRGDEAVVRARAVVPALWPNHADAGPIFWAGATGLHFVGGEWRVRISIEPTTTADACAQRLIDVNGYGLAGAKRRLREIAFSPLAGSVNGSAVTFELAAPPEKWRTDEGWVAVGYGQ